MAAIADEVVVDLRARTDQARRDIVAYTETVDRSMKRVEASTTRAEGVVVQSGNRQRAALQQLGIQFGDFTTQLSLGANVFQAFGAQAGQAAGAMVNFGGTVGRVAGFLAGPAGSLLIALTAVAGMMLTSRDNTEKATDAKRKQGDAAKSLQEAIEDLDAASGIATKTEEGRKRAALETARALLEQEVRTRNLTKAELDRQIALLGAASIGAASGEPGAEGISAVLPLQEARVVALQRLLDDQDKKIRAATQRIDLSDGYFRAAKAAEAATSSSKALEQQLDRERDAAEERYKLNGDEAALQNTLTNIERRRIEAAKSGTEARRAATAARKAERDAVREAAAAERDYYATVKAGNAALEDAAQAGQKLVDERLRQAEELRTKLGPDAKGRADEKLAAGDRDFDQRMAKVTDDIQAAQAAAFDLKRDLASGLTDAIVGAGSLGDALENAFERAAIAALESRIFDLLGGSGGGLFDTIGGLITGRPAPGRASGGNVSAGKLYRVNEGGGRRAEGFVPAGSGKIIPLGRMAAAQRGGGSTTIALTIPVDARGANDPAFTARVARQAVAQAAPQIIETTLRAVPGRIGRNQAYEG